MTTILLALVLSASPTWTPSLESSSPGKPDNSVVKQSLTTAALPSEVQAALDALAKDSATLAEAAQRVAALQAATAELAAAQKRIAADQETIKQLLDAIVNPKPLPPPTKKLELIMLSGAGCAPCILMRPIIAELAKSMPIRELDTASTEGQTYTVKATPTFVAVYDGKEIQRAEPGRLSKESLVDWFARLTAWAKEQK